MYRKLNDVLIASAENVPKVYDSGHKVGFEEGKQAEYDAFWDDYQNNNLQGKVRTQYNYAFYQVGWTDVTYNPKYDFEIEYAVGMFSYNCITDTIKPLDFTKLLAQASNVFARSRRLKTIRKIIVNENTTFSGWFTEDAELETIVVEGVIGQNGFDIHWSTKLSKTSTINIINCLSTTTSGLTVTLSKVAVNSAFGINVDDASTYPEGSEYYNLRNSKSNWTISYA